MGNSQERNEDAGSGARAPEEQAPRGRSGEGAASAMRQLMDDERREADRSPEASGDRAR